MCEQLRRTGLDQLCLASVIGEPELVRSVLHPRFAGGNQGAEIGELQCCHGSHRDCDGFGIEIDPELAIAAADHAGGGGADVGGDGRELGDADLPGLDGTCCD